MGSVAEFWGSQGGAGIGAVHCRIKSWFFDRAIVKRSMDKATYDATFKAGMLIRTIAQRSMRYATQPKAGSARVRPVSKPGEPPRAVRPHPWIRDHVSAGYDTATHSAVIGPEILAGSSMAQYILEFGGRTFFRNKRRRIRRIGSGGEVRIGPPMCRTTKPTTNFRGNSVEVTYARMHSAAQVERANQLQEELYGPANKVVFIERRPFMGPALAKARPNIQQFWSRSIKAS